MMNGTKTQLKNVYLSGLMNSFELELFIGSAGLNDNLFSKENGFLIFVNNATFDSIDSEGIQISPGHSTRIMINKFRIKKQPKPYSQCTENLKNADSYGSIYYKKAMNINERNYHYQDCIYICFQKYLGDLCGCQSSYFNEVFYSEMRLCSISLSNMTNNVDDYKCYQKAWSKFSDGSSRQMINCDCPLGCEETGYTYSVSSAEFPTKNYAQYLLNHNIIKKRFLNVNKSLIVFDDLKQSIARVQIFYNELIETLIEESPKMSAADLVSNIGGTFGLFLGLSFASLIELFEIGFVLMSIVYKSKKMKNNVIKVAEKSSQSSLN